MAKNKIKMDGVSFNREFLESHATEKDFLEAMAAKDFTHIFEGPNRDAKLKDLYAKVSPAKEPEAPAKSAVKEAGTTKKA